MVSVLVSEEHTQCFVCLLGAFCTEEKQKMKGKLTNATLIATGSFLFIVLLVAVALAFASQSAIIQTVNPQVYLPFIIKQGPAPEPSPDCSSAPDLVAPSNGSVLNTITPLYQWDTGSDPNATHFRFEVSHEPAIISRVLSLTSSRMGLGDFRSPANLDPVTMYYWHGVLFCGDVMGNYTDTWSFTTGSGGTILSAPILISPGDGSTLPATQADMQWSAVSGAVDYLVEYREVGTSGRSINWPVDLQLTARSLEPNTTYEWWVSARNDYAIGTESAPWEFTTGPSN